MPLLRSFMGSLHQGNGLFSSPGTQCTAIALFAMATCFATNLLHTGITTFDVDQILFDGNNFYESIISDQGFDQNTYLAHHELPDTVPLHGLTLQTTVHYDIFFGVVGDPPSTGAAAAGAVTLFDSITNGFQVSEYLLATFGESTVAIVNDGGNFYVFDSHGCDYLGQPDQFGSAVMLHFSDVETLLEYLDQRYFRYMFNISPVVFNSCDITTPNTSMIASRQSKENTSDYVGDNMIGTGSKTSIDVEAMHFDNVLESISNENLTSVSDSYRADYGVNQLINKYFGNLMMTETFSDRVEENTHINVEQIVSKYKKANFMEHSYCLKSNSLRKKKRHTVKQKTTNTNSASVNANVINAIPLNYNFAINSSYIITSNEVEITTDKPLESESDGFNLSCMNEAFSREISNPNTFVCASCERFLFANQVHKLKDQFSTITGLCLRANQDVCLYCLSYVKKNMVPPISIVGNNLDPGTQPRCLQGLSLMERRLICKIQVFMTVIVLPGGQYAEKGLAIDFPINLEQQMNEVLCLTLPHDFPNSNVITVAYEYNKEIKPTHVVRKNKVIEALMWLKSRNEIYKDITLKHDFMESIDIQDDMVGEINDTYDEYGVTPLNYTVPNTDLGNLIQNDTPHFALKKCNASPINAYDIDFGEESAFPHLFPFGRNGYKEKRNISIPNFKYFQHKMYYKDGRFRKDISYLLHAVNFYERSRLYNSVNIHMRMRHKGNLTAGDLLDFRNNPDLIQNSYMFMKNMKGTAGYWKNNLLNLLATFKAIGPPSLFVTLSANDMHWPDLIMTLKGCDYETACKVKNGINLVKRDPVLTALHFQRRFKSLLKNVIYGPSEPFGKVVDHFGRIEFQNRGSPHIHLFFWIENFSCIFDEQQLLIQYIDKVISTDSKASRFARKFQTHHHSDYCLRKSGRCRFGFPFSECKTTHLLSNVDLGSSNLKNRFYETKRRSIDKYINSFNPNILDNWQANMDIQIVGNSESAAYYVCAYICKSEPDDLKFALSKLIGSFDHQTTQRSRMLKIGTCVLRTRKLSAQEAAYRLLSDLNLIFSSRQVLSINTKPPGKRYCVLKPKKQREELDEQSTDIFYTNIIDYYKARPQVMNNMCLYDFAAWYVKCAPTESVDNMNSRKTERIQLRSPFEKVFMRKRRKSVIVRLPKFSYSNDDYFYSLLMSFLPFRNEVCLLKKHNDSFYESARDAFTDKKEQMLFDHLQSYMLLEEIENVMRYIQYSRLELASSGNLCENDPVDEEDADVSIPMDSDIDFDFDLISEQSQNQDIVNIEQDTATVHQLETAYFSSKTFESKLKKLTKSQIKVMKRVTGYFKNDKSMESQLLLFITGGAGVGKSYLSRMIIEWLKQATAIEIGKSPVMVCAPTGIAARNILGVTLHTALHLPVQHGKQPKFTELPGKSLKKMRQLFANIHTLIIDEISMVSSTMFEYTHRRLCSIKNNTKLFGGLNIIVVGDLLQLRPIKGRYVFEDKFLWSFFEAHFLEENVRQVENSSYAKLLNRARVGLLTKDDISLLQTRLIHPIPHNLSDVMHIFPTVKQVQTHNKKMQLLMNEICTSIPAIHYFSPDDVEKKKTEDILDNYIPSDDRNAGGLPNTLTISKGTRVMLIRNIYTAKGLVNGAMGIVEKIYLDEEKQTITTIYVRFDDDTIGDILKIPSEKNAIAIDPVCQEFFYKGRIIVREQFPLIPAWAATIHKLQGSSLEKAAISIGNSVFEKGMAYVALSRVKTLSGLYILALNIDKICPPIKPLQEYNRLRK